MRSCDGKSNCRVPCLFVKAAGLTLVIVRNDLLGRAKADTPKVVECFRELYARGAYQPDLYADL